MAIPIPTSQRGTSAPNLGWKDHGDVVEIALLLPANQAEALLTLARRRRQTVGQILRHLIDQALGAAG